MHELQRSASLRQRWLCDVAWRVAQTRAFVVALLLVACVLPVPLAHAQTASFSGTVLMDPTEKPLANAEILFTGLNRSARSDSAGNFLFSGLPLGKHAVTVKLIGYESISTDVTLTNGRPVSVDLLLRPVATKLATVETRAAATGLYAARLTEFEERRKTGSGKYLTASYFEQYDGRPPSSYIVEKLAGLKVVQVNGGRFLASTRGNGMSTAPCYMQVVVNGLVRYNGSPGQLKFEIDELNSKDIIGFEFYTTATTPQQYNATGGGSCGTVVIWTK